VVGIVISVVIGVLVKVMIGLRVKVVLNVMGQVLVNIVIMLLIATETQQLQPGQQQAQPQQNREGQVVPGKQESEQVGQHRGANSNLP
jgi:hypothetical protein